MTNQDKIEEVCNCISCWYVENKKMPGYVVNMGKSYLGRILGFEPRDSNFYLEMGSWVEEKHPGLLDKLLGPHGWAVLQMLIIKSKEDTHD